MISLQSAAADQIGRTKPMPTGEPVTKQVYFPAGRFVVEGAPSFIASTTAAVLSDHLPEEPCNDQSDQRTEHREPKTYVGDQKAMCVHESFVKLRLAALRPTDPRSCSGRGAAGPAQCFATGEYVPS